MPDSFTHEFVGGAALALIAKVNGQGAGMMARVDAMPNAEMREKLRFWVMRGWVESADRDAAVGWAQSLPDENERATWIAKTIEQGGEDSARWGMERIGLIENPDRRAEAAHNVLWPWLLNQPQQAFAMLERHAADWPPDLFRDAGDALTRHDATKAAEAVHRLPEGEARTEFVEGMLTGSLQSTDVAAILPALSLVPQEELIGRTSQFLSRLTKQDPHAAAKWITSLPQGSPLREHGAAAFKSETGKFPSVYLQNR